MQELTDVSLFESIVNSDRCQTDIQMIESSAMFESIVNSDRCQTF